MQWLNPETHIDTNTSGSLSAAVLQLNWLQHSGGGGGTHYPSRYNSVSQSSVRRPASPPSHGSGRDTSFPSPASHAHCHALNSKLKSKSKRQGVSTAVGQINTQFSAVVICISQGKMRRAAS